MNIKDGSAIRWMAKHLARANNRGFASERKFRTVLSHLRYDLKIRNLLQLSDRHREKFLDYLRGSDLSRSSTSTYISYWNRIVEYAGKPELRISAKEEGLSRGSFEYVDRTVSREAHEAFTSWLRERYEQTQDVRYEALRHSVELQREFGLRASESFCIKVAEKDISGGFLHLGREDDTKNGRERDVPIFRQEQEEKFQEAQRFARDQGWYSLIPPDHTKSEWMNFAYHALAEFKQEHPEYRDYHFHGERHAFAQEYAMHLAEQKLGERKEDEAEARLDSLLSRLSSEEVREVKQEVSEALGHSREEVTKSYGV